MKPANHWAYYPSLLAVAACVIAIWVLTNDLFATGFALFAVAITAAFWGEVSR